MLPQLVENWFEGNFALTISKQTYFFKNGELALESEVNSSGYKEIESAALADALEVEEENLALYGAMIASWIAGAGKPLEQPEIKAQFKEHTTTGKLQRIAIASAAFVIFTSLLLAGARFYVRFSKIILRCAICREPSPHYQDG